MGTLGGSAPASPPCHPRVTRGLAKPSGYLPPSRVDLPSTYLHSVDIATPITLSRRSG